MCVCVCVRVCILCVCVCRGGGVFVRLAVLAREGWEKWDTTHQVKTTPCCAREGSSGGRVEMVDADLTAVVAFTDSDPPSFIHRLT